MPSLLSDCHATLLLRSNEVCRAIPRFPEDQSDIFGQKCETDEDEEEHDCLLKGQGRPAFRHFLLKEVLPQQNLWVNGGSGSFPRF